jgi:hypothetical protein
MWQMKHKNAVPMRGYEAMAIKKLLKEMKIEYKIVQGETKSERLL